MQRNLKTITKSDLIRILSKMDDLDRKILSLLREHGPMTREEIVKRLNIPRTTVYDRLVKMILNGLVEKYSNNRRTRGRPKVFYRVTT
ncbi:MAG: winged helix-turn-helix transcriptional regulator [Candidatus Asgardarchaeia archaeon]